MSRIDNVRYIRAEDFSQEIQQDIAKLAPVLNTFMQQTVDLTNGRIDFDNRVENIIQFNITVDSLGKITGNNLFNVGKQGVRGLSVIRAVNQTNPSIFPTGTPFVNYTNTENPQVIRIDNITNIKSGTYIIVSIVY